MKVTNIRYNKIATVTTEENNITTVSTIKTRKATFEFINTLECFAMHISNNIEKVAAKFESMGFDVDVDYSFGFDYEAKIYATR